MKTLKESLLDNIETSMRKGDKMAKEEDLAIKELNYIYDKLQDFSHNSYWVFNKGLSSKYRCTIHLNAARLAKYLGLPAKHIFIMVDCSNFNKVKWGVSICITSATKPRLDKTTHVQYVNYNTQKTYIAYDFNETNCTFDSSGYGNPKYSPAEFITKYVLPMFSDIDAFKENIINPLKDSDGEWYKSKFLPTISI